MIRLILSSIFLLLLSCDEDNMQNIEGCMNVDACNYDQYANVNDSSSCIFAESNCDICEDGEIVDGDPDNDGVCDIDEVVGCTYVTACNFNSLATDDDGSCTYIDGICETCEIGIIIDNDQDDDGICDVDDFNQLELNLDINVTVDSSVLDDLTAFEENFEAFIETQLDLPDGSVDVTNISVISRDDLDISISCVIFLTENELEESDFSTGEDLENAWTELEEEFSNDGIDFVFGCSYQTACNYDVSVTVNDGSCFYIDGICESCEEGVIVDNDYDDDDVCNSDEIEGCTYQEACNYNPEATNDDNSCAYVDGVCDTCVEGAITDNDIDDDGVCDVDELEGCIDNTACNYNSNVTVDDGSCDYVDGICETCENGMIIDNDIDNDEVCDSDEIPGCTYVSACNYNEEATLDNGSCEFGDDICETCENGEIVDNDQDDDTICDSDEIEGCMDATACNYNSSATDDGSCTYTDGICDTCENGIIVDNDQDDDTICDANEIPGCMDNTACNYNIEVTDDDGSCTYTDGICETCENGEIIDNDQDNDDTCDSNETQGCTDVLACNYSSFVEIDDGSCNYVDGICDTCVEGAIVDNDVDNDGVCDENEIEGCTYEEACNYNPNVTSDDGTCIYADGICETCIDNIIIDNDQDDDNVCDSNEVEGCTDNSACNFDQNATEENNTCIFTDGICETCENGGIVDNDVDNDDICDSDEIAGCTDDSACNYNTEATDEDNTCIFVDDICDTCENGEIIDNDYDDDFVCDADEVLGCTYNTACNYNEEATDDDGSCIFVDGICETCENGEIVDNDQDDDTVCDDVEVEGCIDDTACNYDSSATDSVTCIYVDGICETCENGEIIDNDLDDDTVCDEDEVEGCISDEAACNYNPSATDIVDCTYVDGICETCENGEIIDNDQDDDSVCDE